MKKFLKTNLSPKYLGILIWFVSRLKSLSVKKEIGKNTYIDSSVNVFGWSHVSVGNNTLIGEQSWLNINAREDGFKHIKIGDYCYLGRRNLLSSSKELIISDYVMTSNECKFLGNNHIFEDPMSPYIATGTTKGDIQKIGLNCWIGAGSIVLGAVEVGYGSIIGAGSVVTKSISPFSIAVGNPCKVIKRYNFNKKKWVSINKVINDKELEIPTEEEYLKVLRSNSKNLVLPVMAATSRYGDMY